MNRLGKLLPPLASLVPFEAAARLESFTRAAAELNLTQAAVSRQIRALETALGLKLFERRNRGVFLTQAGREFGRTVTGGLESIASKAGDLRRMQPDGEIVLFSQLGEAVYWVMPRVAEFQRQYPKIALRIATSTKPLTEFNEHFDVALQTSSRPCGSHPIVFTASDEAFPVCSPRYIADRATPWALTDLPTHRLLHYKAEPPVWLEWDDWLERQGVAFRVGYAGSVFDSYPVTVQAATEGHGIALGWRSTMESFLQTGVLVRPFAESVFLPDELAVYRRQTDRLRPEVKALLSWLKSRLAP